MMFVLIQVKISSIQIKCNFPLNGLASFINHNYNKKQSSRDFLHNSQEKTTAEVSYSIKFQAVGLSYTLSQYPGGDCSNLSGRDLGLNFPRGRQGNPLRIT